MRPTQTQNLHQTFIVILSNLIDPQHCLLVESESGCHIPRLQIRQTTLWSNGDDEL